MAACKSVVVLAPNARRQTVKVNATSTVLQVLEEVCKKQNLLNDQYALQHQGKILDETLPIRYSGLSNNAHLELVPSPKTKKGSTSSTVGLQLESGERLVKEFASSFSLWDVLKYWDSAQESPHHGKIINPCPEEEKSPVCVYMTQEISGENSLRQATLHSLGLTGKRVMIRLIHRQLTSKADRVEAMEVSPREAQETANSRVSDLDCASVSGNRVDTSEQAVETPSSSSPSPVPGNAKEDKGDVSNDSLKLQVERNTSCPPLQEDVKDPKRPRFSAPKPYFANFKFPEETAGMDLIQREEADSSRREFLATSCDRQPLVFSESNSTLPTHEGGDVPDSFFEVTVDDLRVMLRDLKNDRIQAESAPLMTRAMREVRQESEMYKYDRVVVRVKFPDRLVLQGFFRPMEKVSALTDFVKSHLEDQNIEFYLYTTPPRRVLAKPNSTLFESKLYPASVVHFGSSDHQEHFLKREYLESPSTILDAEKVVIETGVLSVHSGCKPDIGDHVASGSTSGSRQGSGPPSSGPHSSLRGPNQASLNRPQLGGSSKGTIPKWFKGAGK